MWALIFLLITLSVVLGVIVIVLHKILSEISDKNDCKNNKKSLSEHQRMITLINNITDAILSTDEHGIINTYNSAALNLIDTNSGINGEHISQVLNLETTDKKPIDIFKELTKSSAIRQRDDVLMKIEDGDYISLWEIVWELNSINVANSLKVAKEILLFLYEQGYIRLFSSNWGYDTEMKQSGEELIMQNKTKILKIVWTV